MNAHDSNNLDRPGNDHADRLLDANLRELGSRMASDLPGDLSSEELASFKSVACLSRSSEVPRALHAAAKRADAATDRAAGHVPIPITHNGVRSMKRSRMLFGISSAAAAVILASGVLLFTGGQRQQVNASTILNSLRARTVSGMHITLTGMQDPEATVSGEVIVHFRTPQTMSQLLDDNRPIDGPDDVDVLANLNIGVQQGDLAGFGLDFSAAFTPETKWVFAKSSGQAPAAGNSGGLPAMFIHNALRNGVFMDLSHIDFDELFADADPHAMLDQMPPEMRAEIEAEIEAELGHSLDELEQIHDHGAGMHSRVRLHVKPPGVDATTGEREPGVFSVGAGLHGLGGDDAQSMGQTLKQFLTGRAGAEQFDQFRQAVEGAGGAASVEPLGNDRYLLTATGGPDDDFSAVQITYTQDPTGGEAGGVDRIEIVGIGSGMGDGPGTGTAVLTFLNDPIDPALLNPDRLLTPATFIVTQEWLDSMMGFFSGGGFGQSGQGGVQLDMDVDVDVQVAPADGPVTDDQSAPADGGE